MDYGEEWHPSNRDWMHFVTGASFENYVSWRNHTCKKRRSMETHEYCSLVEFLLYQRGHPQAGRISRGWCSQLLQATWLRRWSVGPMPLRPWHMLVAAEESFHSRTENGWGSLSLSEYGEWSASHAPSPHPHTMISHTTANPRTLETPQPAISYNYNWCINIKWWSSWGGQRHL